MSAPSPSSAGFRDRILYDNTTLAVARILGDGTRRRTQAFSHLQSHYLFRDRFGRPGTRLVLVDPDSDQGAGKVVATCQTVEGLAGEILLNDLALEGDAVGSVLP